MRTLFYRPLGFSWLLTFFTLFHFFYAPSALAEEKINENPLHIEGQFLPEKIPVGGNAKLFIDLEIDPPYKAYVDMFDLKVVSPSELQIGTFDIDPTKEFQDTFSGKLKDGVEKKATMTSIVELAPGFPEGQHEATFAVRYQACTKDHCLFPKTLNLTLPFTAISHAQALEEGIEPGSASIDSAGPPSGGSAFDQALKKGTFYTFLFVFIAGLLTSLTPCVFPMIPITLAVLGTRGTNHSHLKGLSLSLTYVLGIALTYSILGVVAAKTGALFGSALSNPYVVGSIAVIFVLMGLSMYGLFELQVPAFIRDKLGSKKTGTGYTGAFFTGLIAGVVASPCVGPVLVAILAYVAQTQSTFLGFFLLFTFAMGLGMLFIALGTFSQLIQKLPRSGNWMEVVKFVFGTSMIAVAIYYVEPLAPDWLFSFLVGAALISISSAFGAFNNDKELEKKKQLTKGVMLATFVIGVFFLLSTFFPGLKQASIAGGGVVAQKKIETVNWIPYSKQALATAKQDQKPVIIDFYADWCAACVELEHLTFPKPEVRKEGEKFTFLKVDATKDSPELRVLKKQYGVLGLPTIVFIDPSGKVRTDLTLTGFEDAPQFLKRMKKVWN